MRTIGTRLGQREKAMARTREKQQGQGQELGQGQDRKYRQGHEQELGHGEDEKVRARTDVGTKDMTERRGKGKDKRWDNGRIESLCSSAGDSAQDSTRSSASLLVKGEQSARRLRQTEDDHYRCGGSS